MMTDEKQVVNTQGEGTPQADPTPQGKTEGTTPEQVGAGVKQKPVESPDRLDKHPRFQEVIQQKNDNAKEAAEWKQKYLESQQTPGPEPSKPQDPYSRLSAEEKEQTQNFIDSFVRPIIKKEYEPFVKQYQTDKLNQQIEEADKFCAQHGIDFKSKMPEIIPYLSRPENKGRLTAKEAALNLYHDEMFGSVKDKTAEQLSREKEALMEKKKQANMQAQTVAPNTVVQSNEMARQKMTRSERLMADIKEAQGLAEQGVRNPKVHVD
jgi:hypothetical protein